MDQKTTATTISGGDRPGAEPGAPRSVWAEHLGDEVDFWRKWIQTKGARWDEDYKRRQDPGMALQPHIRELISAPAGATVKILDVGAGPLTVVGKVWDGRTLEIAAVDPLADEYGRAMNDNGVVPLVRTRKGEAERLTELFAPGTFDLVYALNCLDHSYNPLEAVRQMVLVAKEGCCAHLEHYSDEAERQKYQGLHRWNFRVEDGKFVIWQPGLRIDVEKELGALAEITASPSPGWVKVTLRKRRT